MSWLWRVSALLVVALVLPLARGQDDSESKAKAALALAKAKRDREQSAGKGAQVPTDCHTDLSAAGKECDRTGKPLVLWVGVKCDDYPDLRRNLSEAVHCHLETHSRVDGKAIVVKGTDGIEYIVTAERIGPDTAEKIKAKWKAKYEPPKRGGIGISEDLSKKIPDRRDYKTVSEWINVLAVRGKVPIGEVVCMSAYGKIVQGDGFQYAPDAVDRLGGGKTGPKKNVENGFSVPAVSGEAALAMLESGGALESKDPEWTAYMKAHARGMIAWEKAGRPGMFMGGDVDPILAWRMNENQKALRRSWGASTQNDHNEPCEPPNGATEADWQFYRAHVSGLPADRAKQAARDAEEAARFAEFQRLRDNGTLGPTPTSGRQSKHVPYYTQDSRTGGWLVWDGVAWVPSDSGPPASYKIVGYQMQQESAPAFAGATFQYATAGAACSQTG